MIVPTWDRDVWRIQLHVLACLAPLWLSNLPLHRTLPIRDPLTCHPAAALLPLPLILEIQVALQLLGVVCLSQLNGACHVFVLIAHAHAKGAAWRWWGDRARGMLDGMFLEPAAWRLETERGRCIPAECLAWLVRCISEYLIHRGCNHRHLIFTSRRTVCSRGSLSGHRVQARLTRYRPVKATGYRPGLTTRYRQGLVTWYREGNPVQARLSYPVQARLDHPVQARLSYRTGKVWSLGTGKAWSLGTGQSTWYRQGLVTRYSQGFATEYRQGLIILYQTVPPSTGQPWPPGTGQAWLPGTRRGQSRAHHARAALWRKGPKRISTMEPGLGSYLGSQRMGEVGSQRMGEVGVQVTSLLNYIINFHPCSCVVYLVFGGNMSTINRSLWSIIKLCVACGSEHPEL